jgi:hypothetical protein
VIFDFKLCSRFYNSNIVVSSPPSESAGAAPDPPPPKGDDEIRQMAEAIIDKVVNQLLNEAAEVVLRED